jgi:DNA-binding transcriptional regulator YiaG
MDYAIEVKSLRNDMGMNRMEFCEYFQIPYRTVVDWEAGNRKMPPYVLYLMKFKAQAENMCNKDESETDIKE